MANPTATIYPPYHAVKDLIQRGPRAAQPAASAVTPGTLYCVTDEGARVERSSGTAWQVYSPTPGGGGAGTGDVVGPGAATDQAIALYDGTTGKLIQDSATTIPALTASIESSVTASLIPVDLATETTGTLPDARLSANVQLKPIAATDLPAHHTRHEPGGADAMAVDAVAATGSLRTLGTGAQQAAPGNDARFGAPTTPAAHHASHETGGSDALTALSGAVITSGTVAAARLPLTSGSFTPSVIGLTTAGSSTYSTRLGYYAKLDKVVTIWIQIVLGPKDATMAGVVVVSGFPFPVASVQTAFTIGLYNDLYVTAGYTELIATSNPGDAFCYLVQMKNAPTNYLSVDAAANVGNSFSITLSGTYLTP